MENGDGGLTLMTFKVVLEPGEDGWIVVECPSLPGCVTQGRTEAEAIENVREAIHLWLETEAEKQRGSLPANARTLEVTV
jgi:predicted RNase H-like HicB family nuclease